MKIIVSSSEISLKSSAVEKKFTDRLQQRIREKLDHRGIEASQEWTEGRLFVETDEDQVPNAVEALTRLPGIKTVMPCLETERDIDSIWETVQEAIHGQDPASFAVDVTRVGDDQDYTSPELEDEIGQRIVDEHDWDVDLDDPDLTVSIESRYNRAYVYTGTIEGIGGLPVNRDARIIVPLRDHLDVYAAFLLMKRGCSIIPVYSGNDPDEVSEPVRILQAYDPDVRLVTVDADDHIEAANTVADVMDAHAIGLGTPTGEIEAFDPDPYDLTVLTPACSMTEDEILEAYADIAVPRV